MEHTHHEVIEKEYIGKNLDDDGRGERTGTMITAVAHIITVVIGSGVLSTGPAALMVFSVITYFTSTLLADCYRSPDPITGKRNSTYMDVVRANLGGMKVKLCGLAQYGIIIGGTIGFTITASISMVAVIRSNCFHKNGHQVQCHISNYPFIITFACIEIVLSQIPNFHKLSWLSILAAALGNIAFAYSFSAVLIEIQDTLKSSPPQNKVMKKASLIGVSTTTLFYMLCGCFGYAAFGNDAPRNFLTGQPIFGFVEDLCAQRWPENGFIKNEYVIKIPFLEPYYINFFR
ncbi:hypothetical protein NE237_024199 [Protea cynaroides]|uniref:Amino acid transporter transmembrane domain-containing protein n=1 Tax=Protea cynaroides TaxID=273540 RepID=A0A9Q0HEE0_9MAGN|nr:hypothetical protein NE237_024199 [Protea cynaroides]